MQQTSYTNPFEGKTLRLSPESVAKRAVAAVAAVASPKPLAAAVAPVAPVATAKPDSGIPVHVVIAEAYPDLFGELFIPLKVGIHRDLIVAKPTLSAKRIRKFLQRRTGCRKYKEALQVGAARFDLAMQEAGEVSEDEHAHAVVAIAAIIAAQRAPRPADKDIV